MSLYEKDSIVALATPRGVGALAVIRVSGFCLSSLNKNLFGKNKLKLRYAHYRPLLSLSGEALDNVVVTFFKGPHSFTGEDVLEISCHGGEVIVKSIISDLINRGCRYADPGEFSRRAFLNGKINLSEAEAINNLIKAPSRLGVQKGLMELSGSANIDLIKIKDSLLQTLTIIEHELDFVEGEITETSESGLNKQIEDSLFFIDRVLKGSLIGKKLKEGFKVALVGPPNAGKSSLFNALLGYDHAIISKEKGTTRDAIEVFVEIEGVPIVLIDTAGYWSGKDKLDALGIKKTEKIIKTADILIVVDEKNPKKFIKPFSVGGRPLIFVASKLDLKRAPIKASDFLNISSKENKNIKTLLTKLSTVVSKSFLQEDVFMCTARQVVLLEKVKQTLKPLKGSLAEVDLTERAFIVRTAVDLMKEVFGEVYSEDVLNNIFKGFCVGK